MKVYLFFIFASLFQFLLYENVCSYREKKSANIVYRKKKSANIIQNIQLAYTWEKSATSKIFTKTDNDLKGKRFDALSVYHWRKGLTIQVNRVFIKSLIVVVIIIKTTREVCKKLLWCINFLII